LNLYNYSSDYDVVVYPFARRTNWFSHYNIGYLYDSIFRKKIIYKYNINSTWKKSNKRIVRIRKKAERETRNRKKE